MTHLPFLWKEQKVCSKVRLELPGFSVGIPATAASHPQLPTLSLQAPRQVYVAVPSKPPEGQKKTEPEKAGA